MPKVNELCGLGAGSCDNPCSKLTWTGTAQYQPPEQLPAAPRLKVPDDYPPPGPFTGPPADMWALGVTAFELLTGWSLFRADRYNPEEEDACDVDDAASSASRGSCGPVTVPVFAVQETMALVALWV